MGIDLNSILTHQFSIVEFVGVLLGLFVAKKSLSFVVRSTLATGRGIASAMLHSYTFSMLYSTAAMVAGGAAVGTGLADIKSSLPAVSAQVDGLLIGAGCALILTSIASFLKNSEVSSEDVKHKAVIARRKREEAQNIKIHA